jgi:hypothetical protein
MSCFKKEESNLQIFAQLPQELKDKICLFSGHFKLRYDNKTKRHILVAQLNLQTQEWKEFAELLSLCMRTRKPITVRVAFSTLRLEARLSGLGGIAYTH